MMRTAIGWDKNWECMMNEWGTFTRGLVKPGSGRGSGSGNGGGKTGLPGNGLKVYRALISEIPS